MDNPELDKLLADEAAKVAAMTPEERSEYLDQIVAIQRANAKPYTGGERQARAMRPKPTLADAVELPEIKALVEDAFCEGFAEGSDGGWIGGDYTYAWKKSAALAAIQTKGGA
jgi:hypothetical protein